jgi:hypothetical protein
VIDADLTRSHTQQILINKFIVPEPACGEFMQRLRINRALIQTLSGFVRDFISSRQEARVSIISLLWQYGKALQRLMPQGRRCMPSMQNPDTTPVKCTSGWTLRQT